MGQVMGGEGVRFLMLEAMEGRDSPQSPAHLTGRCTRGEKGALEPKPLLVARIHGPAPSGPHLSKLHRLPVAAQIKEEPDIQPWDRKTWLQRMCSQKNVSIVNSRGRHG